MAQGRMKMGMVLVIMSMLCAGAAALSSTCSSVLMSLSPCLNYIDGNSSTPSSSCCLQFASVVSSQPRCLCEVLNGGAASLGVPINQTKALTLPTACNVRTPPISRCNGAGSITMPPGNMPAAKGSPASVPPSDNDNGSSGANSVKFSVPLLFLVLASTCVPTFATLIR
ncbi:hypothetical protein VIGAN_08065700 [Vigna angularis var. angularis]|nr:hypothetical protein VIGAN_08065700 [Vigna angularis var. angularis]